MKTKYFKGFAKPMGKGKSILLVLLCSCLAIPGMTEGIQQLSLTQAIDIALAKNPDLKQFKNQVQSAQISVDQKKANFLPDLNLSANSSQWYGKSQNLQSGLIENQNNTSLNMGITANFNLFNGFYDQAALQQSQFQFKASEANYTRYKQSILFETLQRYLAVITAGEFIKIEEENLKAQKLQLQRINDFFKAGRRPITDLYQQKAEISDSEYRLLNSQRNHRVSKLQLQQILGLKPGGKIEVQDPGVDNLLKKLATFETDSLIKQAFSQRPDINAQKYQVAATEKEVKAARSGYLPKLSFFVDLGTNYNSRTNNFDLADQLFTNNINTTVGFSLSIPLFDKFQTKNSVATAKINRSTQQLELEKLITQVSLEVLQAYEDYQTAAKQVETTKSNLTYTQAALASIQNRYNVNASTMVELTQSRAQFLQAQYNHIDSKFTLFLRGIAVLYYQGDSNAVMALLNK